MAGFGIWFEVEPIGFAAGWMWNMEGMSQSYRNHLEIG